MADLSQYVTNRLVEYIKLYNEKKFGELMAYYTDDCRLYPPGAETVIGKAAVRASLMEIQRKDVPAPQFTGVVETIQFSDEYAWVNSNYSDLNQDGSVANNYKDGTVWKKVGGEWCVHRDFYNNRPK